MKNRRSDATDVRLDIELALKEPVSASQKPIEFLNRPLWKRAVPVVLALLIGGVIAGTAIWKLRPAAALPLTRFPVTLAEGQTFTNTGRMVVAISPDGSQMVYVANQRLYHRAMSELEARPIPGTETWQGASNPVFSPDGRSLVFYAVSDQTLKKIAVTGGAAVTLCPVDNAIFGMSWGEDGIAFGQGDKGILRVSENGGKPELLVSVETGEFAHGPQVLPGGEAVLYTVSTGVDRWDTAKVFVKSLKPGSPRKHIIDGGSDARYVSTGHIVLCIRRDPVRDLIRFEPAAGYRWAWAGRRGGPASGGDRLGAVQLLQHRFSDLRSRAGIGRWGSGANSRDAGPQGWN